MIEETGGSLNGESAQYLSDETQWTNRMSTTRKRYGLTMTHPPNICPIANKASREAAVAGWKQFPSLSQKHGVKMLSFEHFDP